MSFVSFKNTQDTPSKVTPASNVTNTTPPLSMKLDVVPIPVSSNAVSITTKKSPVSYTHLTLPTKRIV